MLCLFSKYISDYTSFVTGLQGGKKWSSNVLTRHKMTEKIKFSLFLLFYVVKTNNERNLMNAPVLFCIWRQEGASQKNGRKPHYVSKDFKGGPLSEGQQALLCIGFEYFYDGKTLSNVVWTFSCFRHPYWKKKYCKEANMLKCFH